MSWLLGAIRAPSSVLDNARGLVRQTPSLLFQHDTAPFYLASGGHRHTCHFHTSPDTTSGWALVGMGLQQSGYAVDVLNTTAWNRVLPPPINAPIRYDGHYAAIHWDARGLRAYTDPVGVRTLYIAPSGDGYLVSTRLDWLTRLAGLTEIDYSVFGAQWLTFNQLSSESPIKGIQRLGAGGHLHIPVSGTLSQTTHPWLPSGRKSTLSDFQNTLTPFLNPRLPEPLTLSLGLSGGLDSRLLLALMQDPAVHTFGPKTLPDVQTASFIAERLNLTHRILHEPLPDAATCVDRLHHFATHNYAIAPASSVLDFYYYNRLDTDNLAIIDGGFGEIARRQFLNRLRLQGSHDLNAGNFSHALPYILVTRPRLFTDDVHATMKTGAAKQFETLWNALPPESDIGLANKLDLFSLRSRLPNFFGYEQNRLDTLLLNYMPFAQPSVLDAVFGLPMSLRRGGAAFRRLIRQHNRTLARCPLVKGAYHVPLSMPPLLATLWIKASARFSNPVVPNSRARFLEQVKSYALDRVASREVREHGAYDYARLRANLEAYYTGASEHALFVDWWLSFDAWRGGLSQP